MRIAEQMNVYFFPISYIVILKETEKIGSGFNVASYTLGLKHQNYNFRELAISCITQLNTFSLNAIIY